MQYSSALADFEFDSWHMSKMVQFQVGRASEPFQYNFL